MTKDRPKNKRKGAKNEEKEGELSRHKKRETFKLLASPISHAIDADGADVNFLTISFLTFLEHQQHPPVDRRMPATADPKDQRRRLINSSRSRGPTAIFRQVNFIKISFFLIITAKNGAWRPTKMKIGREALPDFSAV